MRNFLIRFALAFVFNSLIHYLMGPGTLTFILSIITAVLIFSARVEPESNLYIHSNDLEIERVEGEPPRIKVTHRPTGIVVESASYIDALTELGNKISEKK